MAKDIIINDATFLYCTHVQLLLLISQGQKEEGVL